MIQISEVHPSEEVISQLIAMSEAWEAENSCFGYRKNEKSDIDGNRIFLAQVDGNNIGYLFGHISKAERMSSIMPNGTPFFEVEELYVNPEFRSRGIGAELFRRAEEAVKPDAEYIVLSTATKNWRAILHFYIEELGMEFWSARLFKKIPETPAIKRAI